MKKYKCPSCASTSHVIRHAKRGKSIRYKCKACLKNFSIKTIHRATLCISHCPATKYFLQVINTLTCSSTVLSKFELIVYNKPLFCRNFERFAHLNKCKGVIGEK